ncbi:T9SS type A sorting domain-containing protein [Natronogracilivirga saccharolytica]|uniref:T9SS type A sorting domain-containing protein n=1 Tax=Natronogracilivirga saccharolytica TaxID=2812953 RepID=A0A8J7S6N0_9BACT|nr:T9SS type A sorting domain-containing protein [Natronogracilivirga saccharolytica]MBP3191243.1 T9SS type A sorting domain-containing protein [Natronogracilivirga saccharolytica]
MKEQSIINSKLFSVVLLLFTAPGFAVAMPDRSHDVYWFDREEFHVFGGSLESGEIDTLGRVVPRYPRTIEMVDGDIYWANGQHVAIRDDIMPNGIWKGDPQNEDGVQIVVTEGSVTKIQVDAGNEMIYWIENVPGDSASYVIRRTGLVGGNIEVLASGSTITSFRLDNVNNQLYWAERNMGKIRRANLDGSDPQDIVTGINPIPVSLRDIEIDPANDALFWMEHSESDEKVGIYRSALDGSNAGIILKVPQLPRFLSVNPGEEKIYWTRRTRNVYRANYDGSMTDTLLSVSRVGNGELRYNATDNRLYWIADDVNAGRFKSVNPTGLNMETLFYGFGTPTNLAIDPDGRYLYWSTFSDYIMKAGLDGSEVQMIAEGPYQLPPSINTTLFNRDDGFLYWVSGGNNIRMNVSDTESKPDTLDNLPYLTREFAYDPHGQMMYWAGSAGNNYALLRSDATDFSGESTEILVSEENLDSPVKGVAIDLASGHLYWTETDNDRIRRANLDGSQTEDFLTGLEQPEGLSIDVANGMIYWNEPNAGKIRAAGLDGKAPEDLFTGLKKPGRPVLASESTGIPTSSEPKSEPLPLSFNLYQNYPNPFNHSTIITYEIPEESHVRLGIYDVTGRRVSSLVDEMQVPGEYRITWNAENLASGVYLYRFTAGDVVQTRQMILIK